MLGRAGLSPVALFNLAVWLLAALVAAISLAVLWAARRKVATPDSGTLRLQIGFRSILLAALVSGLLVVPAAAAAAARAGNMFAPVRVVYVTLVVTCVALGLVLFGLRLLSRVRVTAPAMCAACLLLTAAPLSVWASFIEPYRLRLERVDVPLSTNPAPRERLKVVVIADLQTDRITDYEHDAVTRALAEQPDLILLPGDFFQGTDAQFATELPAYRALLNRLAAPAGVYACQGNLDHDQRLRTLFAGTSVRVLRNETIVTRLRGCRIALTGVDWPRRSRADTARRLPSGRPAADVHIVLSHSPAAVHYFPGPFDLLVSGHTHGGQVVIPGFGPLAVAAVNRTVAAGGLHEVDGRLVYVSRGVGMERSTAPPLRLFCPPELSVLTLRAHAEK